MQGIGLEGERGDAGCRVPQHQQRHSGCEGQVWRRAHKQRQCTHTWRSKRETEDREEHRGGERERDTTKEGRRGVGWEQGGRNSSRVRTDEKRREFTAAKASPHLSLMCTPARSPWASSSSGSGGCGSMTGTAGGLGGQSPFFKVGNKCCFLLPRFRGLCVCVCQRFSGHFFGVCCCVCWGYMKCGHVSVVWGA